MRALGFVVLLALLAHSIPLSSLALELPVTEEPAAEPEETPETIPEPLLVPGPELNRAIEETIYKPVFSGESVFTRTSSESGLLLNQSDSSHAIEFAGGNGGTYRYLQPAPLYTATGSGTALKARMYLARNIETTETPFGGNSLMVTLSAADSEQHVCTLFEGQQNVSVTNALTNNYDQIPVGDASAAALVEFDATTGDCVLEEGTTYEVRLINRVNGDPRWTNGVLYTKGTGASDFFLQVTATDFAPEEPQTCEECASNVLFIPGIKGSRLYVDNGEEEKLWDPIGNEDIRSLLLDGQGRSINRVYAKDGDVLGSVAGFIEFYQGFLDSLGSLANNGTINDWEVVAYDWRLSLDELVTTGLEEDGRIYYGEATSTPYIQQVLRSLAASSKTGKVTIVAHSNGGLVTKALLTRLGDTETSELVDKIIFVGVPQSGAPQALGALLFGYKEGLPWWFPFMVSPATAREMAENSPMGYHLLPTQNYFHNIASDPDHQVARFSANTLYPSERAAYDSAIDSISELHSYLRAEDGGRTKPLPENYGEPNVLAPFFTSYAITTHENIDAWTPPEEVMLYQIAGWGEDTVSGVEFYEQCVSSECKAKYRPMFIEDGDGVVPVPSALMLEEAENVKRYWLDLEEYNQDNFDKDHGNMLEIQSLQSLISSMISQTMPDEADFIYRSQPETKDVSKKLLFTLHSPLTLEVFDSEANRTGLNEDGFEEEAIPGSQYGRYGETQYVIVPSGTKYDIKMRGTGNGQYSIDIQEIQGSQIQGISTIAGLQASLGTFAYFSITNGIEDATELTVDQNGDGIVDDRLQFMPDQIVEPATPPSNKYFGGEIARDIQDFKRPGETKMSPLESDESLEDHTPGNQTAQYVEPGIQKSEEVVSVEDAPGGGILFNLKYMAYTLFADLWNFFLKILNLLKNYA